MDGLRATKSKGVGLIVRAISFQDFQPMWSLSNNVRDIRRTDGQTDSMGLKDRALLCSASRGKILAEFYYVPVFVIWRVGETISVVFAVVDSEMSSVWSNDEVVVLGETADQSINQSINLYSTEAQCF